MGHTVVSDTGGAPASNCHGGSARGRGEGADGKAHCDMEL
jgi:hypothetical protein